MTEEKLKELVIVQKKWYENLPEKLKMNCQIKRAVQSGEMHNWMVCMGVFKMSSEELSAYYQQIKNDHLTDKTNNTIIELNNNVKKLHQIIIQREMKEGREFSDLQLAIAGLK
jgi:hypothetical protein